MLGVERAAFKEAERLGHDVVGPEHGLLAILRGDPADPARLALEEVGLDTARVERRLTQMFGADPGAERDRRSGISPNPAWYRVIGRAEGFAAFGAGVVRPVDLLLALVWGYWPFTDEPAIAREAVVDALKRRGATIAPARLPVLPRPPQFTQRVDFPLDALPRVLALLAQRHPPGCGPTYGFNHDGVARAWVNAEDGIDLQGVVDEALTG